MGNGRQELIVDLSGEQKSVLGFATWKQVSISAIGLVLGVIVFTVIKFLLTAIGASASVAVLIALLFFTTAVAPFLYIAFWPIRDRQGNLLYYMSKQIQIDRAFEQNETGTYLNIQTNHHAVNTHLPYALVRKDDNDNEEQ